MNKIEILGIGIIVGLILLASYGLTLLPPIENHKSNTEVDLKNIESEVNKLNEAINKKDTDLVGVNTSIEIKPKQDLTSIQNCWLETLVEDNEQLTYHPREQMIKKCGELS